MKHLKFCEPWSGKLVRQLRRGVTFAYDLYLGHSGDSLKCLIDEYTSEKGLYNPSPMVYLKYHHTRWNDNSFVNHEVVSW